MQTPQEQAAFFESHKASLIERARQGVDAAVSFIESFEDPLEQRVLWFYSRQALMLDAAAGVDLDTCIGVAQASIRSFLALAETEHDPEQRARRTDMANILSYNLSADLADCWDPDGRERTAAHFEVGLAAALDCIRWREELNKPAGPHSMAWWARGMHELSLGRHAESVASFERSLDFAKEASPKMPRALASSWAWAISRSLGPQAEMATRSSSSTKRALSSTNRPARRATRRSSAAPKMPSLA
jgi:hypothetical protein